METLQYIEPDDSLTLSNGTGQVTFYTGTWIVNGWDISLLGDVFNKRFQVKPDLLQQMKQAAEINDQAAWEIFNNS